MCGVYGLEADTEKIFVYGLCISVCTHIHYVSVLTVCVCVCVLPTSGCIGDSGTSGGHFGDGSRVVGP